LILTALDIVIPVYNEGKNILRVLEALCEHVQTPFRVLICYDFDADDTLNALQTLASTCAEIETLKNTGVGVHGAILTGLQHTSAPAVLVMPADDTYNGQIIDRLYALIRDGAEIAVPSRFIPGGSMENCPWLKSFLVRTAAFTLYHFARLPVHDPTNGFRMFSRRVLQEIPIESTQGFTFSIELLVKAHRLGWHVAEVPAQWIERKQHQGKSRFKVGDWLLSYLYWYLYAFQTTFLRRRKL